jgi:predicted transcriptional regulator
MLLHQLYINYVIILINRPGCCNLRRMEVDVHKLKRLREDRVLSQRELARMADLAYGTIWRLENGYPEARTSTIRKIAGALGVEPRELLRAG